MKPKHRRLIFIVASLAVMGAGLTAILYAFNDNIVFFYTPSQLAEKRLDKGFDSKRSMRIGGLVKQGSIKNLAAGGVDFTITDLTADMQVTYHGLVPSLFREGQGVVAQGKLDENGRMIAETILAKHDEKYMPREVVEALKASGRWEEDGGYKAKAKAKP